MLAVRTMRWALLALPAITLPLCSWLAWPRSPCINSTWPTPTTPLLSSACKHRCVCVCVAEVGSLGVLQLPVIAVDSYCAVVDPLTGAQCGHLAVLLALGSSQQVCTHIHTLTECRGSVCFHSCLGVCLGGQSSAAACVGCLHPAPASASPSQESFAVRPLSHPTLHSQPVSSHSHKTAPTPQHSNSSKKIVCIKYLDAPLVVLIPCRRRSACVCGVCAGGEGRGSLHQLCVGGGRLLCSVPLPSQPATRPPYWYICIGISKCFVLNIVKIYKQNSCQRWDSNPRHRNDWCLKPAP